MKIVVLNGTSLKGVTYHMKTMFLSHFQEGTQIKEYYPKDMPGFCHGCKNCFMRGEENCPHKEVTEPIWRDMMEADLLVFAYPVYALRAPASIKSLLDHICVHWMVHRPEAAIFKKTAVIITNSVGAPNGSAQKDVRTSLSWLGVSRVYTCGAGMMGDVFWDTITDKHVNMLEKKMEKLYKKVKIITPVKHMKLSVKLKFKVCKRIHKGTLKNEETPSLDNQHYLDQGWITR